MNDQPTDSFADMTVEELYQRLKPIARTLMKGEHASHTFGSSGTALADEFFLRMRKYFPELTVSPDARREVAKQAATTMRRILIDHWKYHQRQKRTGNRQRVELTLADGAGRGPRTAVDLQALDDALLDLRERDPEGAELVELRFFGGMTPAEIAVEWCTDITNVNAVWARAKDWLARTLGNPGAEGDVA